MIHVLVVAYGDLGGDDAWLGDQVRGASLVIAADGGAAALWRRGFRPDVVIGDMDSLADGASETGGPHGPGDVRDALAAAGCTFQQHPAEKDETDTELALRLALARGATSIDVLGALGGARVDHALANVLLLTLPELANVAVTLRTQRETVRLLRGPSSVALRGRPGDLVTLLPLRDRATGIMTQGLQYPLHNGALALGVPRGVSNVLLGTEASVSLQDGLLLVIEHAVAAMATVAAGGTRNGG